MSSSVADKLYICLKALVKLGSGPSWAVWECALKAARQVLGGPGNRKKVYFKWCLMNPAHRDCSKEMLLMFWAAQRSLLDLSADLNTDLSILDDNALLRHKTLLVPALPINAPELLTLCSHSQVNIPNFPWPSGAQLGRECPTLAQALRSFWREGAAWCSLENTHPV